MGQGCGRNDEGSHPKSNDGVNGLYCMEHRYLAKQTQTLRRTMSDCDPFHESVPLLETSESGSIMRLLGVGKDQSHKRVRDFAKEQTNRLVGMGAKRHTFGIVCGASKIRGCRPAVPFALRMASLAALRRPRLVLPGAGREAWECLSATNDGSAKARAILNFAIPRTRTIVHPPRIEHHTYVAKNCYSPICFVKAEMENTFHSGGQVAGSAARGTEALPCPVSHSHRQTRDLATFSPCASKPPQSSPRSFELDRLILYILYVICMPRSLVAPFKV